MYSVCAPNIKSDKSCFDITELQEMAIAFNKYIVKNKICNKMGCAMPVEIQGILIKNKSELWHSIDKRLRKLCKSESCWIEMPFINEIKDKNLRDKLEYFTFKPKMPKKKYQWLSTMDIDYVMQQFQELDATFKFVGALPSDFYTQVKVNYKDLYKYTKLAIVFNLDNHKRKGSHWVAFYVDNRTKTIEYFDSTGGKPNKNIQTFIHRIRKYLPEHKYLLNTRSHQKHNSECGVYAMYFIIQRLFGKTFDQVVNGQIITDKEMNDYRQIIFRPA